MIAADATTKMATRTNVFASLSESLTEQRVALPPKNLLTKLFHPAAIVQRQQPKPFHFLGRRIGVSRYG